jgi:hypothetical protein
MQLPGPVRALVGLIATTADEAKHLPDRAIELPMLAVSSALQLSLRAQQRYARLAARGDDVLNRRPPGDEPPSWATFDDPVSTNELQSLGLADPDPALRARAASQLLDELLGAAEDGASKQRPARKSPARKAPATESRTARKVPAKKAPAKRPAKKTSTAARNAASKSDKAINPPRHSPPSRFDTVDDD